MPKALCILPSGDRYHALNKVWNKETLQTRCKVKKKSENNNAKRIYFHFYTIFLLIIELYSAVSHSEFCIKDSLLTSSPQQSQVTVHTIPPRTFE